MNEVEMKAAFDACAEAIKNACAGVVLGPPIEISEELKGRLPSFGTLPDRLRHVLWMCEKGKRLAGINADKANRWLGFVQGFMWTAGISTILEMRQLNMRKETDR
jgi:hypothetical protein